MASVIGILVTASSPMFHFRRGLCLSRHGSDVVIDLGNVTTNQNLPRIRWHRRCCRTCISIWMARMLIFFLFSFLIFFRWRLYTRRDSFLSGTYTTAQKLSCQSCQIGKMNFYNSFGKTMEYVIT